MAFSICSRAGLASATSAPRTVVPVRLLACPHAVKVVPGGSGPAARIVRAAAARTGGVLDAPLVLPGEELGKDLQRFKRPTYKVLLHNDNYNRREYVVKVLLKTIDGITMDDAVTAMQEAHETGVAMVIVCPQEDAERYCEGLRLNGLTSTIEPGC